MTKPAAGHMKSQQLKTTDPELHMGFCQRLKWHVEVALLTNHQW